MTVKTNEASRREGSKSYNEGLTKRSTDNRQNVKNKKEKTNTPLTKVVLRRLPPNMTEEEFLEAVSPMPEHDYFNFATADYALGPNGYTRAYINFKNVDDVFTFRDKFDGYVFVDQKGNEHPAMVEFAPFQKIPKRTSGKKRDARCGTIDHDPDFLAFLETITNPVTVTLPPMEAVLEEIQAQDRELKANNGVMKIKTPLLEFIELKKAEKLRSKEEKKEERRRKEFERKKAREEDKRKKKDVKDHRDIKKKEDTKDDSSVKVLRPERIREDYTTEVKMSRKVERYEKEKQRRIEEDRQKREREKGRLMKKEKEKEREDRMRRHEEKIKVKEEERVRQREEIKEEWQDEKSHVNKPEGAKSKRYSEGRRKEERERERRMKEEKDREKKSKDDIEREVKTKDVEEIDNERVTVSTEPMEVLEAQDSQQEKSEEGILNDDTNQEETGKEPQERDETFEEKPTRKKREKDPRMERRIRNKDRPAMALYRPGQSRLSSRMRQDREEGAETSSSSPSPVMPSGDPKKYHSQSKKEGSDTQRDTANSKEGSVESRSDSVDFEQEYSKSKEERGRDSQVGNKSFRESRMKSNETNSERYYKLNEGKSRGHHTGRKRGTEDDIEVRDGAHGEQDAEMGDISDVADDMKKFPGVKTMTFRRSVSRE
ncbi:regulator of nonsense transcripts 3B-like [Homarus americanus]|uniref:Regulator of nonsense transcripts 3B-like n=1 Tax=Homarus americanus TaxID=6706 RepID=A0A8J5MTX3_HOMAM|nr:regulator of nonsense transcripts 3B-like [Homarus americanus]KAG7164240.1 Regulator of nonsense transcripts 3B-like [Homarus americanus]